MQKNNIYYEYVPWCIEKTNISKIKSNRSL